MQFIHRSSSVFARFVHNILWFLWMIIHNVYVSLRLFRHFSHHSVSSWDKNKLQISSVHAQRLPGDKRGIIAQQE